MKLKLRITGMHCTNCSLLIDDELESLPGVRRATTSYRKQETSVELDEGTAIEDLVSAVRRAGYEATVQARE